MYFLLGLSHTERGTRSHESVNSVRASARVLGRDDGSAGARRQNSSRRSTRGSPSLPCRRGDYFARARARGKGKNLSWKKKKKKTSNRGLLSSGQTAGLLVRVTSRGTTQSLPSRLCLAALSTMMSSAPPGMARLSTSRYRDSTRLPSCTYELPPCKWAASRAQSSKVFVA